jgi:Fatty acid desaturase/2Fe-2S iron-sulfur cluster binding domain
VAGEQAGLELPFGCREGVCHTCVGSARVGDLRNGQVGGQDGRTTTSTSCSATPHIDAIRAGGKSTIGAANIEGGPLFHVISGNLGYQVEHHLYPDMPSTRYGEIAPRVRKLCERYGPPYNWCPFFKQWGMVQRTIARLAFPGGRPRPKPGPYRSPVGEPQAAARPRTPAAPSAV